MAGLPKEDPIDPVPVFVGLNRSARLGYQEWSVSYEAGLLIGMATGLVVIWTSDPYYIAVVVPFAIICWQMERHDPKIFRLIRLWFMTAWSTLLTRRFWGASTYSLFEPRSRKSLEWRPQWLPQLPKA